MINLLIIANGEQQNIPLYMEGGVGRYNVHLISDRLPAYKYSDFKHFRDCTFGFFKDEALNSSEVLDEETLSIFSTTESTVLKMMERYEFFQNLISYDARINLYHRQLKYWINYLRNNRIRLVIFPVNPHAIFDYIIYEICKKFAIKTIILYRTTIVVNQNVSIYLYEDFDEQIPNVKKIYFRHLKNPSLRRLSDRMKSYYDFRKVDKRNTFTGNKKRRFADYLELQKYVNSLTYRSKHFLEWIRLMKKGDLIARFFAKWTRNSEDIAKISIENLKDKKYVYVALHYQPECSTSPLGGQFVHQDLLLGLLMRHLPSDISIFVKGHIRGGVNYNFTKRLSLDQRTFFVSEEFSSRLLIQNSIAVATVTGTAGFEAFINMKPVLMFGSYFYQDAPGVFKIKGEADIKVAVKKIFKKNFSVNEKQVEAFLKAIDQCSIEGWVDDRYASMSIFSEEENCKNIARFIDHYLSKKRVL